MCNSAMLAVFSSAADLPQAIRRLGRAVIQKQAWSLSNQDKRHRERHREMVENLKEN